MGCLYKVFGNGINVPIFVVANHNAGVVKL